MRFLIAIVLLNILIAVYCRKPCAQRDLGKGRLVCVCNTTYCDDLDALKRTPKGVITVFETNESGDRLKQTELKFANKPTINANISQTLTIDTKQRAQKIIGIGAAITDSTGINIKSLPQNLQDQLIKDYFADTGLEYNLVRIPIGGTDLSTHPYSYDDNNKDDFELKHFNLTAEDHDYKIPYMKSASKINPHIKYFGSPWAPPAWMKNNSDLIHGGYLIGQPGGQYYKTFAKYFVKFLDAYKSNDLHFWGITIENEPKAGDAKTYDFNCLGFTPELQREFIIKDLGPTLEAAGYGPKQLDVMIFDDQRDQIVRWANVILKDKEAAKYVAGTAVHWYNNNDTNVGELDKTRDIDPTKYIINTESSNAHRGVGSWENAERYAKDIIVDLNHYVVGYVGWNMVLNMAGGPRYCGDSQNAPISVDATKHEYYKQPSFYTLGHFSKFLVPESVKIGITEDNPQSDVYSTAFQRPDGGVVVIVFNRRNDTLALTIKEGSNRVTHTVKPHEIQTYIYYDI